MTKGNVRFLRLSLSQCHEDEKVTRKEENLGEGFIQPQQEVQPQETHCDNSSSGFSHYPGTFHWLRGTASDRRPSPLLAFSSICNSEIHHTDRSKHRSTLLNFPVSQNRPDRTNLYCLTSSEVSRGASHMPERTHPQCRCNLLQTN